MKHYILTFCLAYLLVSCAAPKPSFTVSGDLKAPASITFKNQSTKADSYEWSFGDLGISTEVSPDFQFPVAGNYLVTLKAKKGKKEAIYYDRVEVEGPTDCLVLVETEFGNMLIKLHNATPEHQANFLKLADEAFYDGLLFHRVINGFMVQGGDPNSRGATPNQRLGSGGPGYTVPAEFVDTLVHVKGALAAARTPDQVNPEKRSSGSQFYIVHGGPVREDMLKTIGAKAGINYRGRQLEQYLELGGYPPLDQNYTVFGQVIEGLDVIDKIAQERVDRANRPQKDVKMKISVVDYFPTKKLNP
ncbi:MAG: peptidylprolyl isomerase [Bacteroidota bacterium]